MDRAEPITSIIPFSNSTSEQYYSQFREIRSLLSGALVPWLEPQPRILLDFQNGPSWPCRESRTHHIYITPLQQNTGAILFSYSWNKKSTKWGPCSVTRPTAKDALWSSEPSWPLVPFAVSTLGRVASPCRQSTTHHIYLPLSKSTSEHCYSQYRERRSLLTRSLGPCLEPQTIRTIITLHQVCWWRSS